VKEVRDRNGTHMQHIHATHQCTNSSPKCLPNAAIHCHILQHLHHTAPHRNTLHQTGTHCNTLQHTATHCTTLHHAATHCDTLQHTSARKHHEGACLQTKTSKYQFGVRYEALIFVAVCVLQWVAVSCSELQCVAVWDAVCCSDLQCVAVCCSVLQCTAARRNSHYISSYIYIMTAP